MVSAGQVEAALNELGGGVEAVRELGGWRTSSEDTTTARVPYCQVKSAPSELELDADAIPRLGGWKTTEDDVAVAFVPAPDGE
jgi:hypothetical protein